MSVQLRFGLLGVFQLRVAGRPVDIRSPKYRTLLAALLVDPGRSVSGEELIRALWGPDLPEHPQRALQLCVTRTRKLLADAGAGPIIVTKASGYSIDVPPVAVDIGQFHQRLEVARRARHHSDADSEFRALTEALGLWRGQPLTDVPSDMLHSEYVSTLLEQRLQAVERRADLQLERGQNDEVVAELTILAEQNPQRETLWRCLIAALHRSGRRSDALSAYHEIRQLLAEELGVDPSEELRQQHSTVLTGAPDDQNPLDVAALPRQLPTPTVGFAGREMEVRRLDALLEEATGPGKHGTRIAVISGMAGVGKTALAAQWSRRVADMFADGQLWLDVHGYHHRKAMTPQRALTTLLRSLGIRERQIPLDFEEKVKLYRSIMDGRRMLIVIDNAKDSEQVLPLIPGEPSCFVLVTSRRHLTGLIAAESGESVPLHPFTVDEARQMLTHRLGAARIMAEPDAVGRIIESCSRLSLPLAIVAARVVTRPNTTLAALARWLQAAALRLDGFVISDTTVDVRAVFSWSYAGLDPPAARLFRYLGLHPTAEFSTAAAAGLVGAPVSQVHGLLDALTDTHLIVEQKPGRFAMHDLLHAYAAELVTTEDSEVDLLAARRRLIEWMAATAFNARPFLQPSDIDVGLTNTSKDVTAVTFDNEGQALEWFEAERNSLIAGIHAAYDLGLDDLCWRLAYAAWTQLHLSGAWHEVIDTHDVGLQAAERSGDRSGQAHMLSGRGIAQRAVGKPDLAVKTHLKALDIFMELSDETGVATTLSNLGAAYRDSGRFDDSLNCCRTALSIDREQGNRGNEAISLIQIGMTLSAAERPAEAVSPLLEAIEAFRLMNHRRGEARTRQAMATTYAALQRWDLAVNHLSIAVDIYCAIGDRWQQAEALVHLGESLNAARNTGDGQVAWQQALAIYEELKAPDAAAIRERLDRSVGRSRTEAEGS